MYEWLLYKEGMLLVLKLITVREGIPTPDDIHWGIPMMSPVRGILIIIS